MNVQKNHILVVDDDKDYALKLKDALSEFGSIDTAHSIREFRETFAPYRYDLILLDLRLKRGKEGMTLLDHIIEEDPSSSVIVISGYGDIATAVEALHKGAKTFLEKNKVSVQEIRIRVEHTIKESITERKIRQLEAVQEPDELIGEDVKIQEIRNMVKLVAKDGEATVLIRGETGTGKELVARAIHRFGIRSQWPFISVALTDVNQETITSELFGHEKGAFTGAIGKHYGFFEQAHKGILFIDEIGDLPIDIQVKLLRVMDNKTFRRMGGLEDISVDLQIVTATNRSLEEMVKDGRFREDLYFRLKVFEIYLPPLRERRNDIQLLALHFLKQLHKKGRTTAYSFSDDTQDILLQYTWPGNVRELKSVVESAALKAKLEDNSRILTKYIAPLLITQEQIMNAPVGDISRSLAELELRMVEKALRKSGGKKTEAWKLLNYPDRFVMRRNIKKLLTKYPDMADKFPELKRSYS